MELFKNKVGRPSNATKRNRKIVVIVTVFAVAALLQTTIINFKASKKNIGVDSKPMNIKVGAKKSGDIATAANCETGDKKITEDDVRIIASISSGLNIVSASRKNYGDINKDGKVDKKDVALATRISSKVSGFQYGDLDKNGVVDYSDVRLISRYLSGYKTDTIKDSVQKKLADINGDKKIDITDEELISRMSFGYGDLCKASDLTKGDGKITQEDADLALLFAGGYRKPSSVQKSAADTNANGKITEGDVRKISNAVSTKNNLFSTVSKTIKGVKITYNSTTKYLTLNGTATGNIDLMRLLSQKIILNDEYTVKLTYSSGTITQTGSKFILEVKENNNGNLVTRNYLGLEFPKTGSKSGVLKINTSASATGNQLYAWISKGSKLVFKNYKIKVEITKKFNTKLVEKKQITKNDLRKVNSSVKMQMLGASGIQNETLANIQKAVMQNKMSNIQKMQYEEGYNYFKLDNERLDIVNESLKSIGLKVSKDNLDADNVITLNGTVTSNGEVIPLIYINDIEFMSGDNISVGVYRNGGAYSVDSADDPDIYLENMGINTWVFYILKKGIFKIPFFYPEKNYVSIPRYLSNEQNSNMFSVNNTHQESARGIFLSLRIPKGATVTFNNLKLSLYVTIAKTGSYISPNVYDDTSNEFKKINYDINALSSEIGSQTETCCHSYAIAYGAYILLGRKPEMVKDVKSIDFHPSDATIAFQPACWGSSYGSYNFGGCDNSTCSGARNINNYADEYAFIVNKINNGIPVSIHTKYWNPYSQKYNEHWVLVVGYRKGVTSISDDEEGKNLLKNVWVIDPFYSSNDGYNNRDITLWEGNPIEENRNDISIMKDTEIRTWDTTSSAH